MATPSRPEQDPQGNPILGIDLGTTNSLVAVFEAGQPRLLPNGSGDPMTPSVVGLLSTGEMIVGQAAAELRVTSPERCASFFKRWMGTERPVEVAGTEYSAIELSSLVLRSIREDAAAALGATGAESGPWRVVITVPAYFNDHQREATRAAASVAGLEVLRVINEPTAAALTYGFHEADSEKRLLVFDLGGGTFDVTLMEIFEGQLEIQATAGESQLGGEDFTDALAAWALTAAGEQPESVALFEPLRYARVRESAEAAKRGAGDGTQPIPIPDADARTEPGGPSVTPSPGDLDAVFAPLLDRLERPVLRVLSDARVLPDEVDEVLLVGGASRLPQVRALVERLLGKEPQCRFDPDQVVALGAAVQAALLMDDRAVEDMVATDVAPHTLGVETLREFGSERRSGYFLPIIHRNTTIPTSAEVSLATVNRDQDRMKLEVYQGEGRMVSDNRLLGTLEVLGIPKGPAGQGVTVRFSYDSSGVLEVEAIVEETGQRFQTILQHALKGLSEAEVKAALKRLSAVKFYPRDEKINVELLAFANRVCGEVNRFQRETLVEVVDAYEASLFARDQEGFEHSKAELLSALSGLGFPFRGQGA